MSTGNSMIDIPDTKSIEEILEEEDAKVAHYEDKYDERKGN